MSFQEGISRTVDWYKFFFSVIFPGGTVGNQVSDSPLGNPFSSLKTIEVCEGLQGSQDEDMETNSNVVKASHQLRERRSRLNSI